MTAFLKRCKQAARWRLRALVKFIKREPDPDAQFNALLSHFIKSDEAPVILDVGAHRGESIERFRKLFPQSTVHAFEPDQDNFEVLSHKWAEKGETLLNNVGVSGSKGTLTFHRNLKSNTSGFHAVNTESDWAKNRSARHNVSPEEYTAKSYDVPVIDLDSYIEEHKLSRINLLKIDTQGHEDEVLAGAQKALEAGVIDVIETELIVGDSYVKSLRFYDLEKILLPLGYKFYGIDNSGDLLTTPELCFNILYVHERLLKP